MPQSTAPQQLESTMSSTPLRRPPTFASFREFYPYYLGQHSHRISRRLHVGGTLLALALAGGALITGRWAWLLGVPLAGYLPAWVGHYFFERNAPATLRHPLYSLRADLSLLTEVLTGRMPW
jgi:hypothetical protein